MTVRKLLNKKWNRGGSCQSRTQRARPKAKAETRTEEEAEIMTPEEALWPVIHLRTPCG